MVKKIVLILILGFVLFGCNYNLDKTNTKIQYISDEVVIKEVRLDENELFIPTKAGYSFAGWFYDKEFKEKYLLDDPLEKDIFIYAKWIKSSAEELFEYKLIGNDEVEIIKFDNLVNTNERVVVPQTLAGKNVTSINGIFASNETIKELVLPLGLKKIGPRTFADMVHLKSINIPNTVEEIGEFAFHNTRDLKQIFIPNSVKTMGNSIFEGSGLIIAVLEEGITMISQEMFAECWLLSYIDIPNTVKDIGIAAFAKCHSLRTVKIPEGITKINTSTFYECSLVEINIPNSVIEIGDFAFIDCNLLRVLVIPKSVHTIGSKAFAYIGFEAVYLPESIVNMGSSVFTIVTNKICYEGNEIPKTWPENWIPAGVEERIEYGIYYITD